MCCGEQVFVRTQFGWADILSPEECVTSEPEWKRAGLSERERAPSATALPCPQAVPSSPQQHTHSHMCTLATHRLHVPTIPQTHSSWDTYTRSYTARAHAHSPPCPACPTMGSAVLPWVEAGCPPHLRSEQGVGLAVGLRPSAVLRCSPLLSHPRQRHSVGFGRPRLGPAPQGTASSWGASIPLKTGTACLPSLPLRMVSPATAEGAAGGIGTQGTWLP